MTIPIRRYLLLPALVLAAVTSSLVTASAASADVCGTPYCGGVVRVEGNAGNSIAITNCWQSGGFAYGDSHPCMTNGWNNNRYRAGKYLAPGETSVSYRHYYDVDGFRVFRGCTVRGYWESSGSPFSYYRGPSQSSMWVRIGGPARAVITTVSC